MKVIAHTSLHLQEVKELFPSSVLGSYYQDVVRCTMHASSTAAAQDDLDGFGKGLKKNVPENVSLQFSALSLHELHVATTATTTATTAATTATTATTTAATTATTATTRSASGGPIKTLTHTLPMSCGARMPLVDEGRRLKEQDEGTFKLETGSCKIDPSIKVTGYIQTHPHFLALIQEFRNSQETPQNDSTLSHTTC
jgi:hypothetical protein